MNMLQEVATDVVEVSTEGVDAKFGSNPENTLLYGSMVEIHAPITLLAILWLLLERLVSRHSPATCSQEPLRLLSMRTHLDGNPDSSELSAEVDAPKPGAV